MTWLEDLPPTQRLLAAAVLLTLLVSAGFALVRMVNGVIDLIVDAWYWAQARRDARQRNTRRRTQPQLRRRPAGPAGPVR